MSIEAEIQTIATMLKDIEAYAEVGLWHPDRQEQIAQNITEADKAINQITVGHSPKADDLSEAQVKQVASLLKRSNESIDKLPSHPFA